MSLDNVTFECASRKLNLELTLLSIIGSLNGGRLFNQATSMTRFYARPMLLIEFDQNKPFALQGKYYLSKDIASSDLVARLQLLTIHFPKLKILWSPSPHATGELFEELKRGRDEPDATKAEFDILTLISKTVNTQWTKIENLIQKFQEKTKLWIILYCQKVTKLSD